MKKQTIVLMITALVFLACAERTGPTLDTEPAPSALPESAYATPTVNGQGWLPPSEGNGSSESRIGDLGRSCLVPDGCDRDSPDYPGCVNANCDEDCALPIFGGLSSAGYCTKSCRYDWECEGAVEDGPYGTEFVCLGDGVNGVCAPGTNARCDGASNGQCLREGEACKMQLIFAPDLTYGAVCQPATPNGAAVGEVCDEESGVACANDLCMFDGANGFGTCMSICDPNAETDICPNGFSCFDDWYAFGTDFDNPVDMCLPQGCEKDANCPDDFYCGLTYEFNTDNILRGYCFPRQEGSARNGDPCGEDTTCEGATCFDSDTENGYCSGLCDTADDCPEGFSCNIVNFGIDADPGSAPAQLCMRGAGSKSPCRSSADCLNDEVCDYLSDGDLENGRPVSEITISGRCVERAPNSVNPGEACNAESPCAVSNFCLRANTTFCGGTCATTQDCKNAYGLDDYVCYGIGIGGDVSGGICVPGPDVDFAGSLSSCRNNADCTAEGEFCGINLIGTLEPSSETICIVDNGAAAGGQACTSGEECQSGFCSLGEDGMGLCSNVCRATIDCQSGMVCESTLVDEELNAFVDLCVVSNVAPIGGGEAGAAGDANEAGAAGDANEAGAAGDANEAGAAGDANEAGAAGDANEAGAAGSE